MEEKDALGVKRAALRRLQAELGIPQDQVPMSVPPGLSSPGAVRKRWWGLGNSISKLGQVY